MILKITSEFSETPGARYRSEGDFSGEEFRETLLEPRFKEAIEKKEELIVNLDGGYGYPTSFLEEAFGGLARKYGTKEVKSVLRFVSEDEPPLIEKIMRYIEEASKR